MISSSQKRGFTLVEMLIVIVIIGVLAAALIPRLTSVRGRANDTARKADIQQLTTAILAHQLDYNGKLPVPATGSYSISGITNYLITAGMDGTPSDPTPENVFSFSGNSFRVETGQYGYIRIKQDGVPNEGFVLMAKTQTVGGSNRVVSDSIGTISTGSSVDYIVPCTTITKSGSVLLVPGGDCFYTGANQLRYIMVR